MIFSRLFLKPWTFHQNFTDMNTAWLQEQWLAKPETLATSDPVDVLWKSQRTYSSPRNRSHDKKSHFTQRMDQ